MAVLSRRVRPDDWKPVGVEALEANALKVVRSTDNHSVIAGPGAGKTELLAQRAAYLLQTSAAPASRRILAISFKRDAATNLAARVRQRCHRNHAVRFDSITFDAFAKGLIDRFGQALPERWRPRPDYEIIFPNDRDYRDFLYQTVGTPPASVATPQSRLATAPYCWCSASAGTAERCRSTACPTICLFRTSRCGWCARLAGGGTGCQHPDGLFGRTHPGAGLKLRSLE
jgi:hypothetical protein